MVTNGHNPCYGRIVADTMHPATDRVTAGKVFDYELKIAGGIGRSDRVVHAKSNEWNDRLKCEEFVTCYRLSLLRLTVEGAVADR